jgi:crotonobetainyl-CoA:carnitine CoA-transferase CaiB-like acyl-CoA transferase
MGLAIRRRDYCCNMVRTLQEALDDPHFVDRGLFSAAVRDANGAEMRALPLPLAPVFRPEPGTTSDVPRLGEHNAAIFGDG